MERHGQGPGQRVTVQPALISRSLLLTHYAIKVRELVGLSRSEEDGYESDDGLEPGWSTPTWRRPASAVGVGRRDGGLTMPGRRVRLSTTEGVMMKRLVIVLLHETVTAANDDDEMRREEDVTAFSSVAAIGIHVRPDKSQLQ
jgi:hypothetical protein